MSLALRDVALGLVELAFPESRPVVRGGGYREAVGGQEGGGGGGGGGPGGARRRNRRSLSGPICSGPWQQFCPAGHWIHPQALATA